MRHGSIASQLSDLELLCTWMRQAGITAIKLDGLEIQLGPIPAQQQQVAQPVPEAKTADQLRKELDELLFASSGG